MPFFVRGAVLALEDVRPGLPDDRSTSSILISATFTCEPIGPVLQYWLRAAGIGSTVTFTSGRQVIPRVLDASQDAGRGACDVNVLLLRLDGGDAVPQGKAPLAEAIDVDEWLHAFQVSAGVSAVPWLVVACPPAPAVREDTARMREWQHREQRLLGALDTMPGIVTVRADEILRPFGLTEYYDDVTQRVGDIPYTAAGFAALGTIVARRIHALLTPPRKVIVVDCDNTLWAGLCGELGPTHVTIDAPRRALQQFLIEQTEAGVLLCLCSRNEAADVWAVFDSHGGMVLRRSHVVAARIDWRPKSENIRSLSEELQLDTGTFIFIDDQAAECAEVEARLPEVLTLRLPEDAGAIPSMLAHSWAFDRLRVTAEDRARTQQYHLAHAREQVRRQSATLEEFLDNLQVQVQVAPAREDQLVRIAQLTQRTTQGNCTLKRRTEAELRRLHALDECAVLAVDVRDRLGDYGLVGALIVRSQHPELEIDTLVLSCRVLGRRVEQQVLDEARRIAMARGHQTLRLRFIQGPRNAVARAFLDALASPWTRTPYDGACDYVLPLG